MFVGIYRQQETVEHDQSTLEKSTVSQEQLNMIFSSPEKSIVS